LQGCNPWASKGTKGPTGVGRRRRGRNKPDELPAEEGGQRGDRRGGGGRRRREEEAGGRDRGKRRRVGAAAVVPARLLLLSAGHRLLRGWLPRVHYHVDRVGLNRAENMKGQCSCPIF
jgi:hypothetical protein